ncbi:uncharacterized protein LOC112573130 isoform X2 [Pomacea canaliculata]|uniref:uncharacterized protein LOC112573130 isoform X2 n=1 Tax=Pomacea canaliculata TaxID=400727 RepID=UPI000D7352B9|nr:uncharacterized protein LOC112573130 isoform X2 [Pomacea canaliculata]
MDDDCLLQMQDSSSTVTKSAVTVKTNVQVISDVCQSLANDKCLTPEDRAFFNQGYKGELLEKVKFLDDCLVPCKMFVRAAREKAWSLYHAAYIKNMSSVVECTKSTSAAAWLCLKTFEKLIALNYPVQAEQNQACQSSAFHDKLKDIIAYIGGSIVAKIKRLCKGEEQQCLDALCTKHDTTMLTATLDRGGLIYLNEKAKELFYALEHRFVQTCRSTPSSCRSVDFAIACVDDEELLHNFYSISYKSDISETAKQRVFCMVARLYFQIRIHHECHKFMERHQQQQHASKSKQRLRKSLQDATNA